MMHQEELTVLVITGKSGTLPDSLRSLEESGYTLRSAPSGKSILSRALADSSIGLVIAVLEDPKDIKNIKAAKAVKGDESNPLIFLISEKLEMSFPETELPDYQGILPLGQNPLYLKKMIMTTLKTKAAHPFHFLDSMEDAFFLLDPVKGFVDCNRKTLSLFEVDSREDFLKLDPVVMSPEFQYNGSPSSDMAKEIMKSAMEKGSVLFQWSHKRLNGENFQASIILSRLNRGNNPLLLGIIHEMALSEKIENALAKQEVEYRSTLDNLSIGVIVHGADTSILLSNPAAEKILGLTKEQMDGRQVMDPEWSFIDEKGNKLEPEKYPVSIVMATKRPLINSTIGIVRSDRHIITWVLVNAIPILDEGGHLNKIIVNFYDITELKTVEEALNKSRKMDAIGQLAGGVAHEFNNLLGGIISSAELLKIKFPAGGSESTYIEMILHSSQRAADLNTKLLSLAGKEKSVSNPINIHAVIDETVGILKSRINKKIKVTSRKKARYHTVTGDSRQLQNALLNLCHNAADAMTGGGEIVISTENLELEKEFCHNSSFSIVPGNYVYIEVQDSGTGISRSNLKKIFEPFFTTKVNGRGAGLGLSSVYVTMQQHNGAITVYSEEGEGSSFHLYLPLSEGIVPLYNHEKTIVSGTGLILLVDDEKVIRITTREMLESMNYEVLSAKTGQEAIDMYRENSSRIDMVLLDMVLPDMNGREAFNIIREINPDAKVVISSGFAKSEDLKAMTKQGLSGFIRKPYRKVELSHVVSETLKG